MIDGENPPTKDWRNGILLEHQVARYFADAEALYSYERAREANTLIVGKAILGLLELRTRQSASSVIGPGARSFVIICGAGCRGAGERQLDSAKQIAADHWFL